MVLHAPLKGSASFFLLFPSDVALHMYLVGSYDTHGMNRGFNVSV